MAKILTKSYENQEAEFPKFSVILVTNRYFVVIAFKMLKMEFNFKYTILITIVQTISTSLLQ